MKIGVGIGIGFHRFGCDNDSDPDARRFLLKAVFEAGKSALRLRPGLESVWLAAENVLKNSSRSRILEPI